MYQSFYKYEPAFQIVFIFWSRFSMLQHSLSFLCWVYRVLMCVMLFRALLILICGNKVCFDTHRHTHTHTLVLCEYKWSYLVCDTILLLLSHVYSNVSITSEQLRAQWRWPLLPWWPGLSMVDFVFNSTWGICRPGFKSHQEHALYCFGNNVMSFDPWARGGSKSYLTQGAKMSSAGPVRVQLTTRTHSLEFQLDTTNSSIADAVGDQ